MEPENKIIERFEEIFENKDKKLLNTILLDSSVKELVDIHKGKGLNSLLLAKALYLVFKVQPGLKISIDQEILEAIRKFKLLVLKNENLALFDWVIETLYYGMYDLATAAIAKEGFKCTTHYTTRLTLEYLYCIKGRDREKLFKIYDKILLKREQIQKLKKAQEKREIARYRVSEKIGLEDAEELLNDANEFRKEIIPIILE